MKRKLGFLVLLLLVCVCLLVWRQWGEGTQNYSEKSVPLAEVCEELSFGIYRETDWETLLTSYRGEYLTREILSQILTTLGVAEYIKPSAEEKGGLIGRAEWNEIYRQILDLLDTERTVVTEKLLVLDRIAAEEGTILVTNQGDYTTALPQSYFSAWQGYEVYCLEGRCIGIAGVNGEELTVSNAYLTSCADGEVQFLYGGASYRKQMGATQDPVEVGVCDIVVKEGEICALRMKQDRIEGKLLSYDDAVIEIEGYGKISHPKHVPVYQTYGDVQEKSLTDVVLGNMQVTYVTGEQQVCAILIGQPADIRNIRVLLLAEDGTNYRSEVYVKSDAGVKVRCGEKEEVLAAGTLISAGTYLAGQTDGTLVVRPEQENGLIFLCDAAGNAVSNGYPGAIEVRSYAEGYTVVNDVPFETYLCAVVPSEMPSSYAPEALKAQAVCARSYAYIQLLRADLAEYGAHINDSTSYQVYNKTAATEAAKQAVYGTAGKLLLYEGKPVEAYYFSTSMGYTDTAEVWNVVDMAPYGYLKSACLNRDGAGVDLSDEETFRSYIRQKAEGYDSDVKYYRWFATADYREKTQEINQILLARKAAVPGNIRCFAAGEDVEETEVTAQTLEGYGRLVGISVQERSRAGAILTLALQYEKGSVLVKNEYNIRKVLGAGVGKMVYADSTESTGVTMLPSAFCSIAVQEDGTAVLSGGGYGHGLGMSQNGANGMAKAGMNYEEILQYFYQNITIGSIE